MTSVEKAKAVLSAAETSLREVLAGAAREGEYAALQYLTSCATALSKLLLDIDRLAGTPEQQTTVNGSVPILTPRLAAEPTIDRKAQSPKQKAVAKYPKFLRRGDSLIKIGWSKKSKQEYLHKAPRYVLSLVAKSLSELARGGKLVNANDVTTLSDPATETEVPGYQVYLCLAWLRDVELIEQEGRQGYRIVEPENLQQLVDRRWENLVTDAA
jgi:hypothetical protein